MRPRTPPKVLPAVAINFVIEAWGDGAVREIQIPFILRLSESQMVR